jgi:hypothetical protein
MDMSKYLYTDIATIEYFLRRGAEYDIDIDTADGFAIYFRLTLHGREYRCDLEAFDRSRDLLITKGWHTFSDHVTGNGLRFMLPPLDEVLV